MKAIDLARILKGSLEGNPEAEFSGFSIDSRNVREGDVFVALKGERHDGHNFIWDAFYRGAVGAVSEKDVSVPDGKFVIKVGSCLEALRDIARFRRKNFKGTVIGVAGSVGKTTTKELIHHLLSCVTPSYKSEGNLNSQIGLPLVMANMPLNVDYAVLEIGASRRGDVLNLTKIAEPRIRVITAIGEEHLETFGSVEDVVYGNGEIFYHFGKEDWAVLPASVSKYYQLPEGRRITFGKDGDIKADHIRLSLEGVEFESFGERFSLPVLSVGIVENVLASFGVLRSLSYDPRDFRTALSGFKSPKGRMNILNFGDFYVIDDTYNANPPSVRNAIDTLHNLKTDSRKVVVLGDMLELGEESIKLHSQIGSYLKEKEVDYAIFYGDHMFYACKEFVRRGGRGVFLRSKDAVFEEMLKWMRDKNIILLKGSRGMKMETLLIRIREFTHHE